MAEKFNFPVTFGRQITIGTKPQWFIIFTPSWRTRLMYNVSDTSGSGVHADIGVTRHGDNVHRYGHCHVRDNTSFYVRTVTVHSGPLLAGWGGGQNSGRNIQCLELTLRHQLKTQSVPWEEEAPPTRQRSVRSKVARVYLGWNVVALGPALDYTVLNYCTTECETGPNEALKLNRDGHVKGTKPLGEPVFIRRPRVESHPAGNRFGYLYRPLAEPSAKVRTINLDASRETRELYPYIIYI